MGTHLTQLILNVDYFTEVRILVRRKTFLNHPKLKEVIVDFDDLADYENKFGEGEIIFSCIGTTQKKVKGDNVLYEKIDHDIPVNAARIGFKKGFK